MAGETDQSPVVRDLTLRSQRIAAREVSVQSAFRGTPLFGVIQGRRAGGEQPVVVPRIILQAPLWCSARAARQVQGMRFEWVQPDPEQKGLPVEWVVETINPLDHNLGDTLKREGDPFGRLQWFDQDLLFCLSLEFFRRNCQTTHITIDQTSVLEWIGYKQVHDPPYAEIRSSIKRMSWTQIAWYRKGEKEHARGIDLLSKESGWERGTRSRPGEILALLSDTWLKQIYDSDGDRQVIDLTRYFHLVRHIRNTDGAPDLARSVYTYLASIADQLRKGVSIAKTDWLIERFAQRQVVTNPRTGETRVHLRYADPLRQGQLADAIHALVECGICRDAKIDGDRLQVEWASAKAIGAIPTSVVQTRLLDTDLRTGNTLVMIGHEGLPDLSGKTLAEATHEVRSRCQVSQALDAEARRNGWASVHLAAVYGAGLLLIQDGRPDDAGTFVARTLVAVGEQSEPAWAAWWPDAIRTRDAALFERLFGADGLYAQQAAEIAGIHQGPETIASMRPPGQRSLAERALDILRPLLRVDRSAERNAAEQGWSADEIARLYIVALYRARHDEIRRPGAWAAKILRDGYRDDWSTAGLKGQGIVADIKAMIAWAYAPQGPLASLAMQRGVAGEAPAKDAATTVPDKNLVAFAGPMRDRLQSLRASGATSELRAVQDAITALGRVMAGRAQVVELVAAAAALMAKDHDPLTITLGAEVLAAIKHQ